MNIDWGYKMTNDERKWKKSDHTYRQSKNNSFKCRKQFTDENCCIADSTDDLSSVYHFRWFAKYSMWLFMMQRLQKWCRTIIHLSADSHLRRWYLKNYNRFSRPFQINSIEMIKLFFFCVWSAAIKTKKK